MVSEHQTESGIRRIVNILGWYGRNNMGDEAFKVAFGALFPDLDLRFVTEKPDPEQALILGGGDVIKEFYLKEIERPFVVVGAGLGYPSELNLLAQKQQFLKAAWFRNEADAIESVFYDKIQADKCPDLAFMLPQIERNLERPSGRKRVAVILAHSVVNPKMGTAAFAETHYQEYMHWEIAKTLDVLKEWYEIHFVPMSRERFAYDETAHYEVSSRMTTDHHLTLWQWSDADPIKFLHHLAGFDLIISMKFHGLIFATILGIPFVNIGLTRKTSLYCEEAGFSNLMVTPYSMTSSRLLDRIKNAEQDNIPGKLLAHAAHCKKEWQSIGPKVREALFPVDAPQPESKPD